MKAITIAAGAPLLALTWACAARAGAQAPVATFTDSIPGTLVRFELVRVPGDPPLWIGRTEVTWDAYDVFAWRLDSMAAPAGADATARPSRPYGAPDRGFGHQGYPAISVTRVAAEAYCAWLSARTGRRYRLPTDAEWSRVMALARGEAPLDSIAWHGGNSGLMTHPVGTRHADALGLFDLLGNAAEWVATGDGPPVLRGGSYRDAPERLRPDARAAQDASWNETDPQFPKSRWWLSDGPFAGFRVVREP